MFVAEKNFFADLGERGFYILEKFIPSVLQRDLERDLLALYEKPDHFELLLEINRLNESDKERLYSLYLKSNHLKSFINIKEYICKFLTRITESSEHQVVGSGILQAPTQDRRLAYDWHQESAYMPVEHCIHFQFPVFMKADSSNGSMSVLEGSNLLGHLEFVERQASQDAVRNRKIIGIETLVKSSREVVFEMSLGDCGVFLDHTIHRSNVNSSKFARLSGVVRVARAK